MAFLRQVGMVATLAAALLAWQGARHSGWAGPDAAPAKPPAKPTAASAKKPDGPLCDRAAFRVVVDVGHTAQSPGAPSARGFWEYDFNLRLAKLIERALVRAGFGRTVLLITDGPAHKSLAVRVARANALGADLFLSIHHDSVPDSFLEVWEYDGHRRYFSDRFKGHSIFISNENVDPAASLFMARLLGEQLKAHGLQYTPHYVERFMGHRQRILVDADAGVYRYDQLIVLRTTQMPAVLLEAGSIINREEELQLGTPERESLISAAVTEAVDGFCAVRRPRPERPRPATAAASAVSIPKPR
jgi:N-acetylmuramoyl-L-alanine amidase